MILKIYGFRLGEIVANADAKTPQGTPLTSLGLDLDSRKLNFGLLMIFIITLLITVILHFGRLSKVLISKKHAYTLTAIVLLKVSLLLFDLFTNAFLLYEVLVFKQEHIFSMDLLINLVLSIITVSSALGLTTNVLVNFPLHFTHIKMQLRKRKLPTGEHGEHVSNGRIMRAAARKTFHPFITMVFGTYSFFALAALGYVLYSLYHFDYTQALVIPSGLSSGSPISTDPTTTVFTISYWSDPNMRKKTLIVLLWLDIMLNYAVGVCCGAMYWVWQVLQALGFAVCKCCCYGRSQATKRRSSRRPVLSRDSSEMTL